MRLRSGPKGPDASHDRADLMPVRQIWRLLERHDGMVRPKGHRRFAILEQAREVKGTDPAALAAQLNTLLGQ